MCFFLFTCSLTFKIITYIWADTEKVQLDQNGPFSVSACMNVMILNGKQHANKQKKRFNIEFFTGKRKESFIMFSFWGNNLYSSPKLEWQSLWDRGNVFGYGECILKNLYKYFNWNGRFSGVLKCIVLWAFKFQYIIQRFDSMLRL